MNPWITQTGVNLGVRHIYRKTKRLSQRRSAGKQVGVRREPAADKGVVSLLPGEQVRTRLLVNHIRDGRPFDGYLYVTSQRLVYLPWEAAGVRGAVPFDIPLTEVFGADVAPRGSNWRDGSLRRRLRITKVSGNAELFVVWQPQKAAELLERARQGLA